MPDLTSDPAIVEAYNDVRSDKSDTNWLALRFNASGDKLNVAATGTNGLNEFTEQLEDHEAVFGFVRMNVGNDALSQRSKFVFVQWCGSEVKVMRKAKLSIQSGQVKETIKSYAVEIQTDHKEDLAEEKVTTLLRKAMGANYDRQASEY